MALAIFEDNASFAELELGTFEYFVDVLGSPVVVECRVLICEVCVPVPGSVVWFFLVELVFLKVVAEEAENAVRYEGYFPRREDIVHQLFVLYITKGEVLKP